MSGLDLRPNRKYPNISGITDDVRSHRDALRSVVEALNIGQRRTNDIESSYIRVSDLVDLGIISLQNGSFATTPTTYTPSPHTHLIADVTGLAAALATIVTAHTGLTGLTIGDAGHTQLALLAGRSGGQTFSGGDTSGQNLTLRGNSAALNGQVIVSSTTPATTITDGALRINGGLSVALTAVSNNVKILGQPANSFVMLGGSNDIQGTAEAVYSANLVHNSISTRSAANCHPISAITGLAGQLFPKFTDNTVGTYVVATLGAASNYLITCDGVATNTEDITTTSGFVSLKTNITAGTGSNISVENAGVMQSSIAVGASTTAVTLDNLDSGGNVTGGFSLTGAGATGTTNVISNEASGSIIYALTPLAASTINTIRNQAPGSLMVASIVPTLAGSTNTAIIDAGGVAALMACYVGIGEARISGFGAVLTGYVGGASTTTTAGGFGSRVQTVNLGTAGTALNSSGASSTIVANVEVAGPTVTTLGKASSVNAAFIGAGTPVVSVSGDGSEVRLMQTAGSPNISISGLASYLKMHCVAGSPTVTVSANAALLNLRNASGSGTFTISTQCVMANLNVSGSPTVTISQQAGFVTGQANAGTLTISAPSTLVNVSVTGAAQVTAATGLACQISGQNASAASTLGTVGAAIGARVRGQLTAAATANCTAGGEMGRAEGRIPGAFAVTGGAALTDYCAWAYGDSTLGAISATAPNAIQFFPGANAVPQSIQFGGAIALGGIRIHAFNPAAPIFPALPAGVGVGSIWMDGAGIMCIMDAPTLGVGRPI